MDSRHSEDAILEPAGERADLLRLVDSLQEAARRGDWQLTGELAEALSRRTPPATRDELGEYLTHLKNALIVARASRAHMAASLVRLNAAAGFNHTRVEYAAPRQEFGESADF
jgi:hypothetical protein